MKKAAGSLACAIVLLGVLLLSGKQSFADEISKPDYIPRVEITTAAGNGNAITKPYGYVAATIKVIDGEETVAEDTEGYVRVRGNSTADAAKKRYTFKFSEKTNLFKMGKAKKWVLLANCFDPTLLRNAVALKMAQDMGLDYST